MVSELQDYQNFDALRYRNNPIMRYTMLGICIATAGEVYPLIAKDEVMLLKSM